jgi:hypothetical protein
MLGPGVDSELTTTHMWAGRSTPAPSLWPVPVAWIPGPVTLARSCGLDSWACGLGPLLPDFEVMITLVLRGHPLVLRG